MYKINKKSHKGCQPIVPGGLSMNISDKALNGIWTLIETLGDVLVCRSVETGEQLIRHNSYFFEAV